MNCKKCGSSLVQNSDFCPTCGEKVENETIQNIFLNEEPEMIEILEEDDLNKLELSSVEQGTQEETTQAFEPVVQEELAQSEPEVVSQLQAPKPLQQSIPNVNMATSMPAGTTSMKKKRNVPFIIVLILIVLGLAIFVGIKLISGSKTKEPQIVEDVATSADTSTSLDTSNKIIVDRFEFTLPSGYTTTEIDEIVYIKDSTSSVAFSIEKVANESITDYIAYAQVLITNLQQRGLSISTYAVKELGGIKYLIIPIDGEKTPHYLYFTGINQNYIVLGEIVHSIDTTLDTTLIKTSTVISSASGGTNIYAGAFTGELPNKTNNKFLKQIK